MTAVARYFAVADPDSGAMVFMHRNRRGDLVAWPPGADYGPTLWRRPGPGREHIVPASLVGLPRRLWVNNWHGTVRADWLAKVSAAIDVDPITAAARFAALRSVCFCCGRHLEDLDSRAWGVGPDCRAKLPAELLQAGAREVGRALAAREQGDDEGGQLDQGNVYRDAVTRFRDEEDAA